MALYGSTLVLSLVSKYLEEKTLDEDPLERPDPGVSPLLRWMPLGYLLDFGSLWALTQATFEGFGTGIIWETTPKSGTMTNSPVQVLSGSRLGMMPGYAAGTLIIGIAAMVLGGLGWVMAYPMVTIFYAMLAAGCGWGGLMLVGDLYRAPSSFELQGGRILPCENSKLMVGTYANRQTQPFRVQNSCEECGNQGPRLITEASCDDQLPESGG